MRARPAIRTARDNAAREGQGMGSLRYSIASQLLTGDVAGKSFSIFTVSGGGRGSTRTPHGQPDQKIMASWDHRTKTSKATNVRGGPLPPGFYIVHAPTKHAKLGLSAYLEPTVTAVLHMNPIGQVEVSPRDFEPGVGFYIHGRGKLGSDGCLVPMDQFHELMAALKKDAGLPLRVVDAGMPGEIFEMVQSRRSTA
jgi:hypothetical protein